MPKWKNIAKLSASEQAKREEEFEASVMAHLSQEKGRPPTETKPQPSPPASVAASSEQSITISVTENGKTTTYADLDSVPLALRQRILNAWLAKPAS